MTPAVLGASSGLVDADVVSWQAAVASLSLVGLTTALAVALRLGVSRDIVIASVRAAVQLLAVGFLLALLFDSDAADWWAWVWIGAMITIATFVVVRRAGHHITGLLPLTLATVLGSTIVSLGVVFGFGVIDREPIALVVIAGITIGNAVPSAVLAVNQSLQISRDRVGDIEALLSLGFTRRQVMQFMAPRAARNALIPQVERVKVVGIIALPGAMTGLLLAGVDPIHAVVVQLLVMYLVLGTAALCVVTITVAVTRRSVTDDLRVETWVRIQ
jgi:putative ABC transport system permease protein